MAPVNRGLLPAPVGQLPSRPSRSFHLIPRQIRDSRPSNTTTILTAFTCFPRLLPELGIMIWGYFACCEPKNVVITPRCFYYLRRSKLRPWTKKYATCHGFESPEARSKKFVCYKTSARQPPTILHVNSEARAIGFEYYRPEKTNQESVACFNVSVKERGLRKSCNTSIWINWANDTLVVAGWGYCDSFGDYGAFSDPDRPLDRWSCHMGDQIKNTIMELPKGMARVAFASIHRGFLLSLPLLDHLGGIIIFSTKCCALDPPDPSRLEFVPMGEDYLPPHDDRAIGRQELNKAKADIYQWGHKQGRDQSKMPSINLAFWKHKWDRTPGRWCRFALDDRH